MASKKRLEELEYNVYRKDLDETPDGIAAGGHTGCLTILGGIVVTVIVIVILAGFMQIGRNGPSPSCAAPGCTNKPRAGSNYCWLHSSSYSGGHIGSGNTDTSPKDSGSKEQSTGDKIWNGSRNDAPQTGSLIN